MYDQSKCGNVTGGASISVIVFALTTSLATNAISAQQEIDNVAAFAHLYGVARWFYPSDAAAALTDGRAISSAESVMGYVRDYKLGTIIGGTTAGANGNVAGFSVPGGFSISLTGMRVTRHDGMTAYHTAGVSPDIPLEQTLAG